MLAPPQDAGLDQAAELATLRAELEAFKLDKEKQQAEIEAVKLENKKFRGEVKWPFVCASCLLVRQVHVHTF